MHVVNVMFSKGLGGIEQAMVDYCEALILAGHKVTAVIYPNAKIKDTLLLLKINIIEIKNFSSWDFFAKAYIKKILKQALPDAVIVHGNRAISLVKGQINKPIIGVTHNYSIKHLIGLDGILATTLDLKTKVIEAGQPADKVIKLPNMVRADQAPQIVKNLTIAHDRPIVIGSMGRFVKKKGFDVLLKALFIAKENGLNFKAVIGGSGEEAENLQQLSKSLNVDVDFSGWVTNKAQFFADIDIFCLPSIHEPFGIILLEAFAHKKPVITADAEGPSEIAENEQDALIVSKNDAANMAAAIMRLANNDILRQKIAQNGFKKAESYDIKHFSASLSHAVGLVVHG